ncbi:hypothetical protein NPIL_277981 [Nephila pilipes]|uniref:Uncharacterized protein n=1 Tax=Nephila pilipes TaxID=299642 RepID=A0A8X6P921_NEPPI|nr:hypothetical protein NPIL_277981 [Nephila pilipes]
MKENCKFLKHSDKEIQDATDADTNYDQLQSSDESNISSTSSLHSLVIDLDYDSTEETTRSSEPVPRKKIAKIIPDEKMPSNLVSKFSGENIVKSDFSPAEHSNNSSFGTHTCNTSEAHAEAYFNLKNIDNSRFIIERSSGKILTPTSSNKIYIKPNDKNFFLELSVKDAKIFNISERKRVSAETPVIKTTKEILLGCDPLCKILKVNEIMYIDELSTSKQCTRFPPTLHFIDDKLPNRMKRDQSFPLSLRKIYQDSRMNNESPQHFSSNVNNSTLQSDRNNGQTLSKREMSTLHKSTGRKYAFQSSFYNTTDDSNLHDGDSLTRNPIFGTAKNKERSTNHCSQPSTYHPNPGGLRTSNAAFKPAKKNEVNCFEPGKNTLKMYPDLVSFTASRESSLPFQSLPENPNSETFYSPTNYQNFNSSQKIPNSEGIFLDSVLQSSDKFGSKLS